MTAQIDQDLQNRARDASGAIGDGSALSSTPALAGALAELVGRVEAARLEHAAAVDVADRDGTENRLAALALGGVA